MWLNEKVTCSAIIFLVLFNVTYGFLVHPWIINLLKSPKKVDNLPPVHKSPGDRGTGKHLSPINIQINEVKKLIVTPLSFSNNHWDNKNFFILNNTGHIAEFTQCPPRKSLTVTGGPLKSVYKLDNFHAHWHPVSNNLGTEHSINQLRYAMEFHALYFNKNYGNFEAAKGKPDGLTVVTFIVEAKPGAHHNPSFEFLSTAANTTIDPLSLTLVQYNIFLPFKKLALSEKYFHYVGTVTGSTTEPVKWIIFKGTVQVHPSQIEPFRRMKSMGDEPIQNIRDIQTEFGRTVYYINNAYPNVSKKFWKFLNT